MLEDPMFAVVFILEYVIGEPVSDEDRKVQLTGSDGEIILVMIEDNFYAKDILWVHTWIALLWCSSVYPKKFASLQN